MLQNITHLVSYTHHDPCRYVSQAFFLIIFPSFAILYETMHMNDTIGTMINVKKRCKNNPQIKFYKRSSILFWISICMPNNNSWFQDSNASRVPKVYNVKIQV